MAGQDNVAIVKAVYSALLEGDPSGVLTACTDDVIWIYPGSDTLVPFAGVFAGHIGIEEFFERLNDDENIRQFEPREFLLTDDRVIVLGHYCSRIKSNHREFETDFVHIFTLRDGKINRFQDFFDTAAELEAYGTLVFP